MWFHLIGDYCLHIVFVLITLLFFTFFIFYFFVRVIHNSKLLLWYGTVQNLYVSRNYYHAETAWIRFYLINKREMDGIKMIKMITDSFYPIIRNSIKEKKYIEQRLQHNNNSNSNSSGIYSNSEWSSKWKAECFVRMHKVIHNQLK